MTALSQSRTLFRELRRRRVLRSTVAYLAAAFVLLQGADLVIPALPVPAGTYTFLTIIVLMGLPVVIIVSWFIDITPHGLARTLPLNALLGETNDSAARAAIAAEPDEGLSSIAVLPFVDMSAQQDQEYFSDGLTEELLTVLSKRRGLRVAARTSSFAFKGRNEDVRDIGRKLRVAVVLEGSVRKAGNQLRITAQLIKTADGYQLWSQVFDRELVDVFAVQDEISIAIVDALQPQLDQRDAAAPATVATPTRNVRAYELYLLGLFHYNKATEEDVQEAVGLFQRAIDEDPAYAQAYVGLARAYSWALVYQRARPLDLMPRARAAAERAIALDPGLAEAYAAAGYIEHTLNWDRDAAEELYRKALELNGNLAHVYGDRAELLWSFGRLDESLAMVQKGLMLDPLSVRLHGLRAVALLFQRRYDDAIDAYRRVQVMCPDSPLMYLWTALGGLLVAGRHTEAAEDLAAFARMIGEDPADWTILARGVADPAQRAEALARAAVIPPGRIGGPYFLAGLFAMLGDDEQALDWLETAVDERHVYIHSLRVEPWFERLHQHPRFRRLLERTGLVVRAVPPVTAR
jgi:serine/threonine-protein kinase